MYGFATSPCDLCNGHCKDLKGCVHDYEYDGLEGIEAYMKMCDDAEDYRANHQYDSWKDSQAA